MCEIVRALLVARKFVNFEVNMLDLGYEFLDFISCYGDDGQTKVCAATSGAFLEGEKWLVMFEPALITYSEQPTYKLQKE